MGFSMGAATSIIIMAEDQRIKTGVFNSSFTNATDVLAENAEKPKEFLMVKGAEHTRLWQVAQTLTTSKVVSFFKQTL